MHYVTNRSQQMQKHKFGIAGAFRTVKNNVAKIPRSGSEMVLRNTKHTTIYPGLGPSLEVIALCVPVLFLLKQHR
jgi:hypothetical protein